MKTKHITIRIIDQVTDRAVMQFTVTLQKGETSALAFTFPSTPDSSAAHPYRLETTLSP